MKSVRPFIAVAILLVAGAVSAASGIAFKDATAFMPMPALGSGYVTLTSEKDDRITGLSSPCCDAVELHTMSMKNGMMSMRKLDTLDLKAGVPAVIAEHSGDADSMHLMLIGVHRQMKPGQHFPITFILAKQGTQKATFTVAERGAKTTASTPAAAAH